VNVFNIFINALKGGNYMNPEDMLIIVIVLIMVTGFVYVNFILPKKVEKEEKQKKKTNTINKN